MNVDETLKLALKFHNNNDLKKANKLYDGILALYINHPDANHLSGLISLSTGNFDDALAKIEKAIATLPREAIYYNSLGNVFKLNEEYSKAESAYFAALEIDPRLHEASHNLGKLYEKTGNLEKAKFHLTEAIYSSPKSFESIYSLARILLKLGQSVDAVNFFKQALKIEPQNPDIMNGLALALEKSGKLDDSLEFYKKSLELQPNGLAALSNLGHALHASGRADQAIIHLKNCIELDQENQSNWDRYLFALVFSEASDREVICRENRRWGEIIEREITQIKGFPHILCDLNKKIKIGYYSKEFYSHVTSFFFETLLNYHDRESFEIHCYSDCIEYDSITQKLEQKADFWISLEKLEPNQIADKIRLDQIDIFVGTTNFLPSNRIVSAYKPAPIVVSYMNQVSSTGLSEVDYLITDDKISPTGDSDDFFSEELIRLSDFICYCPPEVEVELKPPPVITNKFITFGCFNNLAKLNHTVISTWSDILNAVPDSKIRLVTKGFKDITMQARYFKLFEGFGVKKDRVEFVITTLDRVAYLSQYNFIDIALDPFPFTGGTVSDEALYMSVPLITLAGNAEMGRMSMSKLSRLNLHELIAYNIKDYIKIATDLSSDIDKIKKLKIEIRKLALATIFDGKNHVNALECAYRQMWENYCMQNNSPA